MERFELFLFIKVQFWNFPGGPMVRNQPATAEDMGLIAGLGSFHMLLGSKAPVPQLLSPRSRAASHNYWAYALQVLKPVPPGAYALQQWEAYELQLESSSHLLQLEKACAQQQRPSTANKIFFLIIF